MPPERMPNSASTVLFAAFLPAFLPAFVVLAAGGCVTTAGNDPADPGPAGTGGDTGPGPGSGGGPGGGSGGAGQPAGTGGRGGTTGAGGRGGGGTPAGTGGAAVPASCGTTPLNEHPFGCSFAWGMNNPSSGSFTSYAAFLQFMSYWVGSDVRADGTFSSCAGCNWLNNQVKNTNLVPVFYAYFIGFYGHVNGLPDGNTGGPPNLTTDGANLIRNNRAKIVQMHAWYAQQAYAVWKTKPLVWLLDGDYVQYTGTSQKNPLTYTELADLAAEVTCAIKNAMPNAVVAINHSAWNANEVTNGFWGAMKDRGVYYDLVWTTGKGNTGAYLNSDIKPGSYNATTGTYAYLHQLTGKTIFVDTSFGASASGDSWSNAGADALKVHIGNGVIAANVSSGTPTATAYSSAISSLGALPISACP